MAVGRPRDALFCVTLRSYYPATLKTQPVRGRKRQYDATSFGALCHIRARNRCSRSPSSTALLANSADSCSRSLPMTSGGCSHCLPACLPPYRCGQGAVLALAEQIDRQTLRCQGLTRDRYRGLVARYFVGGEDPGMWLVAQGWALAFWKYIWRYLAEEDQARRSRRGLKTFATPWGKSSRALLLARSDTSTGETHFDITLSRVFGLRLWARTTETHP